MAGPVGLLHGGEACVSEGWRNVNMSRSGAVLPPPKKKTSGKVDMK